MKNWVIATNAHTGLHILVNLDSIESIQPSSPHNKHGSKTTLYIHGADDSYYLVKEDITYFTRHIYGFEHGLAKSTEQT